jgi:hypothetical protein
MDTDEKFEPAPVAELALDEWTFWEHYEPVTGQTQQDATAAYMQNMKKIACFNDVFSFWQCWNSIKVNDLRRFFYDDAITSVPTFRINDGDKRISQISLFRSKITPKWEDA